MSQNRAAERDRMRAEYDFHINRKAEREIIAVQEYLRHLGKITERTLQKVQENK